MSIETWPLPVGWCWLKVGDVARWSSGGTPRSTEPTYYGGNIPWLVIGDLNDSLVMESAKTITRLGLENSTARMVKPGSVLIALYGSIGKLGISGILCTTNQAIAFTESISTGMDRDFLFHFLKYLRPSLLAQGQGGAQANISQTILREVPICVPPINEQRRIVAKLEALLAKVDASRKRLERIPVILNRFRQAVLAAACNGRLTQDWREQNPFQNAIAVPGSLARDRKEQWERRAALLGGKSKRQYKPGFGSSTDLQEDIPETWSAVTVSQMSFLDIGFAFKSPEFSSEGIRLLRGENLEPGRLRWVDTKCWPREKLKGYEHLLVEEGEIILALDRPVISSGLKIARATQADLPCLLVQRMMRFKVIDPQMTGWLFFNLSIPRFILHLSEGLTGSDLPHVTGTGVAEYTLGLPPIPEQLEIERRVGTLFSLADQIEARYAKAKAQVDRLTQSILAKAFRGELVPQDPNDEPADALLSRLASAPAEAPTPARRRGRPPRIQSAAPPVVPAAPAEERETPALADLTPEAIRQAHREVLASIPSPLSEDNLLRAVALRLGFQRLGGRIKGRIKQTLSSALN